MQSGIPRSAPRIAAVAGAALLVGAFAWGRAPVVPTVTMDGAIVACYQIQSGNLRLLGAGVDGGCRSNEREVQLAAPTYCPEGTIRLAGACIETTAREPLAHFEANHACAAEGRRLAGPGELYAIAAAGYMQVAEWSDDLGDTSRPEGWVYLGVAPRGNGVALAGTELPFRCVE